MRDICRQGGFVVAKKQQVTLKYFQQVQLPTAAAGDSSVHTFRCNSIFDPDFALGGTQPVGHDEWSDFYKYYRVDSCKIKATFFDNLNSADDDGVQGVLGIRKHTDDAVFGTLGYASIMANNMGRTRWKYATSRSAGKGYATVTNTFKHSDTGVARNDADSWTQFGGNPGSGQMTWLFDVFHSPVNPAETVNLREVTVQMWFKCTLKERKSLELS